MPAEPELILPEPGLLIYPFPWSADRKQAAAMVTWQLPEKLQKSLLQLLLVKLLVKLPAGMRSGRMLMMQLLQQLERQLHLQHVQQVHMTRSEVKADRRWLQLTQQVPAGREQLLGKLTASAMTPAVNLSPQLAHCPHQGSSGR